MAATALVHGSFHDGVARTVLEIGLSLAPLHGALCARLTAANPDLSARDRIADEIVTVAAQLEATHDWEEVDWRETCQAAAWQITQTLSHSR